MANAPDVGPLDVIAVILERAGSDSALRSQLVSGGASALRALGVGVPDGVAVKFVEDSATVRHFVIPSPAGAELTEADLDKVAGGAGQQMQMRSQQMGRPAMQLESGDPIGANPGQQMGRGPSFGGI
jgi:hypothetical protein